MELIKNAGMRGIFCCFFLFLNFCIVKLKFIRIMFRKSQEDMWKYEEIEVHIFAYQSIIDYIQTGIVYFCF